MVAANLVAAVVNAAVAIEQRSVDDDAQHQIGFSDDPEAARVGDQPRELHSQIMTWLVVAIDIVVVTFELCERCSVRELSLMIRIHLYSYKNWIIARIMTVK